MLFVKVFASALLLLFMDSCVRPKEGPIVIDLYAKGNTVSLDKIATGETQKP